MEHFSAVAAAAFDTLVLYLLVNLSLEYYGVYLQRRKPRVESWQMEVFMRLWKTVKVQNLNKFSSPLTFYTFCHSTDFIVVCFSLYHAEDQHKAVHSGEVGEAGDVGLRGFSK